MSPTPILIDCDPGHDDAIALLLALASPEVELLGVTTVHGNQTLEKTTANALRVLELAGPHGRPSCRGRRRALERELVGRRPRPRRERARRPGAARSDHRAGRAACRRLPRRADRRRHRPDPDRPAHQRRPAARAPPGRGRPTGRDRPHGRRDRRGEHDAGGRVQHLGRPRGGAGRLPQRDRRDDGRARRHAPRAADDATTRSACARPAGSGRSSPTSSSSSSATTWRRTAGTARRSTTRSPSPR